MSYDPENPADPNNPEFDPGTGRPKGKPTQGDTWLDRFMAWFQTHAPGLTYPLDRGTPQTTPAPTPQTTPMATPTPTTTGMLSPQDEIGLQRMQRLAERQRNSFSA